MPENPQQVEQVFRFVSFRPPELVRGAIRRRQFFEQPIGRVTAFRAALSGLEGSDDATKRAVDLAAEFLASPGYAAGSGSAEDFAVVDAVALAAESAALEENSLRAVVAAVERKIGAPSAAFVRSKEFELIEDRLWDSLYAQSVLPNARANDRAVLLRRLRYTHLLREVADLPTGADELPGALSEYLTATPLFPGGLWPRGRARNEKEAAGPASPSASEELNIRLSEAQVALTELRAQLDEHQVQLIREAQAIVDTPAETHTSSSWLFRLTVAEPKRMHAARTSIARLTPESVARLGERTRRLVREVGGSFELTTVPELMSMIESRARQSLASFVASVPRSQAYRIGSVYLRGALTPTGPRSSIGPTLPGISGVQGRIRNKGIADLMVVRQTLQRYQRGEIAHIENVMASESRKRSHRRLARSEQEVVREVESTQESERDLQSAERFEMQHETDKTVQLDASVKAGITVTGGFGPVETTAYADFALQASRTESTRTATTYARDVTERSVARLMERERELRTRRTLEESEEINRHGFENVAAESQHISGVYRWVDKIYQAQVFNYGRRLMLEFSVPEPAAFYRHAEAHRGVEGVLLEPPESPTVVVTIPGVGTFVERLTSPSQLDRVNYIWPVGQLNVEGVEVPPPERTVVAAALEQAAATTSVSRASSELKIPDGYVAGTAEFHNWRIGGSGAWLYVQIGNFFTYNSDGVTTLNYEDQMVPLSALATATPWVMNVEVMCQLRPEAFADWQVKTFNAIMIAYREREAAYREQLAAAAIRQGVAIVGRNPARNREIERTELKKACIRIISEMDFSEFNAMRPGGARTDYPEFNVRDSIEEGRKIQFFEQAFEWEQLTYLFYPYFWSNRGAWLDIHQLDDVDPLFAKFLQAGAARVMVPVRPPFNNAVLHYLSFDPPPADPWNGGDAPIVNDPLYISLAAELREMSGGRSDGIPIDEPWQVTVPTSLVILQATADLPDYIGGGG